MYSFMGYFTTYLPLQLNIHILNDVEYNLPLFLE